MPVDAKFLINHLGLQPHPEEGGYYRENYRCSEAVERSGLPDRYPSARSFGTAIYYLLASNSFSAMHRLRTDEVFHFYLGDPVRMVLLHLDGSSSEIVLGTDLVAGQQLQVVIPRGTWFGSSLIEGGEYALMGTTMSPGFEFEDYEHGDAEALAAQYPSRADDIRKLSR